MKTVLDINNALDSMCSYMFKVQTAFEAINLLKKKMYSLTKNEEVVLLENFDKETFPEILEYIVYTFEFYEKNRVFLPIAFRQQLILKYINNFDQIVSSCEDLFECTFVTKKSTEIRI